MTFRESEEEGNLRKGHSEEGGREKLEEWRRLLRERVREREREREIALMGCVAVFVCC